MPHEVTDTSGMRHFQQQEVEIAGFAEPILGAIRNILTQSASHLGYNGIEVGFVCLIGLQQAIISYVTSNKMDVIYANDIDVAFDKCSEQILTSAQPNVLRGQFYHTHPRTPIAQTLSRPDMDEGIRQSRKIEDAFGVRVPFDMHAVPMALAVDGQVKIIQKPFVDEDGRQRRPVQIVEFNRMLLRATIH